MVLNGSPTVYKFTFPLASLVSLQIKVLYFFGIYHHSGNDDLLLQLGYTRSRQVIKILCPYFTNIKKNLGNITFSMMIELNKNAKPLCVLLI